VKRALPAPPGAGPLEVIRSWLRAGLVAPEIVSVLFGLAADDQANDHTAAHNGVLPFLRPARGMRCLRIEAVESAMGSAWSASGV